MSPVLVEVVRGELVESRHHGVLIALDPLGDVVISLGDVNAPIYPRSCSKPLQLAAMLRAGLSSLDLPDAQLAIAAASHSGEAKHIEAVLSLLSLAGLDESALDNTPGMPINPESRDDMVRAGSGPDRLHQNCSGKHAAMLATCVVNGWPIAEYRESDHPLQAAIRSSLEAATGETVAATTVDGCGAALFAFTSVGLARAFLGLVNGVPGSPEATVAAAMKARPDLVGGDRRNVTALLQVRDVVAKDGAEGVYAAVSKEFGSVVLKIDDGSSRARTPAALRALNLLGLPSDELSDVPIEKVLGHGDVVGELRACF